MKDKYILKKNPQNEQRYLRSGEYIQISKTAYWATYKCPKCGFPVNLSRQKHHVDYLGDVNPITTCPHKIGSGKRCEFSAYISLEDWVPEAMGSA